jgi:hypothetical protein
MKILKELDPEEQDLPNQPQEITGSRVAWFIMIVAVGLVVSLLGAWGKATSDGVAGVDAREDRLEQEFIRITDKLDNITDKVQYLIDNPAVQAPLPQPKISRRPKVIDQPDIPPTDKPQDLVGWIAKGFHKIKDGLTKKN